MEEYHETVQKYTFLPYIRRTMEKFKECFAKQSNETQHNVFVMEVIINFPLFALYNYIYLNYITIYTYIPPHTPTYIFH